MKNIVTKFYVAVAFLCSTAIMLAQPGSTSDDVEPGGMEGADNQAPIGDYIWVLAVVVILFTFWKMKVSSQHQRNMLD